MATVPQTAARAVTLPCSRCGETACTFTPPTIPADIRGFLTGLTRIPLVPGEAREAIALFLAGDTEHLRAHDVSAMLAIHCPACVRERGQHGRH